MLLSKQFETRAAKLEQEIHELAGEAFNLRSNAKIGELLFDTLKLHEAAGRKKPRRTAKGTGYSTDESTLDELKAFHPIPAKLLEWRGVKTDVPGTLREAMDGAAALPRRLTKSTTTKEKP